MNGNLRLRRDFRPRPGGKLHWSGWCGRAIEIWDESKVEGAIKRIVTSQRLILFSLVSLGPINSDSFTFLSLRPIGKEILLG
jgi:hypothetical protein